jgi:hypothetical protein
VCALIHRQTFHGLWPKPPQDIHGIVRLPRTEQKSI